MKASLLFQYRMHERTTTTTWTLNHNLFVYFVDRISYEVIDILIAKCMRQETKKKSYKRSPHLSVSNSATKPKNVFIANGSTKYISSAIKAVLFTSHEVLTMLLPFYWILSFSFIHSSFRSCSLTNIKTSMHLKQRPNKQREVGLLRWAKHKLSSYQHIKMMSDICKQNSSFSQKYWQVV